MNKIFAIGIATLLVALFVGGVYAAGQWGAGTGAGSMQDRGAYHEQMEDILETGTYSDLEALREETGRPLMRWVQDAESFAEMQERHEQMEAQYGEGPHYKNGGGRGGCRMR